MLNKDKISRVKGILSAKEGTQVPKFLGAGKLPDVNLEREYQTWIHLPGNENKTLEEFLKYKNTSNLNPGVATPNIESRLVLLNKALLGAVSNDELNAAQAAQSLVTSSSLQTSSAPSATPKQDINPTPEIIPVEPDTSVTLPLGNGSPVESGIDPQILGSDINITTNQTLNSGDPQLIAEKPPVTEPTAPEKSTFAQKANSFVNSKGMQTAGKYASGIGAGVDMAESLFVDKSEFADDDPTQGKGRAAYDAVANSLMGFAPVGTIIGGAMKTVGLVNDLLGSSADGMAVDRLTIDLVGGSYGGSTAAIGAAAAKAGKKYGLFSGGAKRRANREIAEAKRLQLAMQGIAAEARDRAAMSTLASQSNNFSYQFQMDGGYDLRYLHAAKDGAKIQYFKDPFKVKLTEAKEFFVTLTDTPPVFKQGGTLLDLLDAERTFNIVLTEPEELELFKQGGTIKDREIDVVETNTTQKSVIPEGALHKNKHHLDEVGVDDSELTKKGIPVVDNEGEQLAEIELNEIIFTLEVTKELESRYKEFYSDGVTNSRKDELAIEAGRLLWKEIIYNTDDRTGLIDTLKLGGVIKAQEGTLVPDALRVEKPKVPELHKFTLPEFKNYKELLKYLKETNRDSDSDYDLEGAFNDPEIYNQWRETELENPGNGHWSDKYKKPNHITFSTESIYSNDTTKGGQWLEFDDGTWQFIVSPYLMSKYSLDDYIKHFENEPGNTVIYGKKKYTSKKKHKSGGTLSLEDINIMVKQALLNILTN